MVPNFLAVLAHSPDALNAFPGLRHIAEAGQLDSQTSERIALVVAESNSCEYCVSAHSAIGRKAGLSYAEIESARAPARRTMPGLQRRSPLPRRSTITWMT